MSSSDRSFKLVKAELLLFRHCEREKKRVESGRRRGVWEDGKLRIFQKFKLIAYTKKDSFLARVYLPRMRREQLSTRYSFFIII